MKRILVIATIIVAMPMCAKSACEQTGTIYTSCKPGYYKSGNSCNACPNGGTSPDKNTGGISNCRLPAGTVGSDSTGTYKYVSDCYY